MQPCMQPPPLSKIRYVIYFAPEQASANQNNANYYYLDTPP